MTGKDICKRIRELRKSTQLTQSQFAELVDMSEDSIGKIERGVTVPAIDTLYKIASAVKIPVEKLIVSSEVTLSKKSSSKAITDLITYLKTRTHEDIKFIHELTVKILERKNRL